jgi:apolipoprotein D and lipocalin family protein
MMQQRCCRGTGRAAFMLAPLVMILNGCGLNPGSGSPPLETVAQVDIQRYMGKWYEIAKYPVVFENGCFGVTAEYALKSDGNVQVVNTCRTSDGQSVANRIEGFATVADPASNAKLTVYFFYPFGAAYWIIELDADYQYAVVGDPSRTYLWILSRTPTLDPDIYAQIIERLPDRGYDPARLELMPQFTEGAP